MDEYDPGKPNEYEEVVAERQAARKEAEREVVRQEQLKREAEVRTQSHPCLELESCPECRRHAQYECFSAGKAIYLRLAQVTLRVSQKPFGKCQQSCTCHHWQEAEVVRIQAEADSWQQPSTSDRGDALNISGEEAFLRRGRYLQLPPLEAPLRSACMSVPKPVFCMPSCHISKSLNL